MVKSYGQYSFSGYRTEQKRTSREVQILVVPNDLALHICQLVQNVSIQLHHLVNDGPRID